MRKRTQTRTDRRAPLWLILLSALIGLIAVAGGLILQIKPAWLRVFDISPHVCLMMIAGGLIMALPFLQIRKRRPSPVETATTIGALVLAGALGLNAATVYVGGRLIPINVSIVDLSGEGLENVQPLTRLRRLRHLDLSDNALTDVTALSSIDTLDYADLTGNPVSKASYTTLRHALDGCFILCEAEDDETTELTLTNQKLPDLPTLMRVIAAHTALETLDTRGTSLTDADVDALREAFPALTIHSDVRVGGETFDSGEALVTIPDTDFDEIMAILGRFPSLEGATLTGRAMWPDEVRSLQAAYPHLTLRCSVALCGASFDLHATDIDLSWQALDPDYMADLDLFRSLERLTLPAVPAEQYREMKARRPEVALSASILIGEEAYDIQAESLDLSGVSIDDIRADDLELFTALRELTLPETTPQAALRVMSRMPGVRVRYTVSGVEIGPDVTELDLRGTGLTDPETLRDLCATAPALESAYIDAPAPGDRPALAKLSARFVYDFTVLGQPVSTAGPVTLDLDRFALDDMAALALERQMDCLEGLEKADMYSSRLSRPVMDHLFDRYRAAFFGWTYDLCDGRYTLRTDITAFSTLKGSKPPYYTEDEFRYLRYCKNLMAIDLGHNHISDISFLENFPHLRILILADNRISDISPLSNLRELEYAELFMNRIWDVSPLSGMDALLDLNLCYNLSWTRPSDLDVTPLETLQNLERLWISGNGLTQAQQDQLTAALPGCDIKFRTPGGSTAEGWREHPRYDIMYACFTTREYRPFD